MKIWKYYLIPDKEVNKKKYELYAITNSKKIAERFESERNMKKFVKGDISDLDEEDAIKFINDNSSKAIDIYHLETKVIDESNRYIMDYMDVLCTYEEYLNCSHESVSDMIFNETLFFGIPHYRIFNKKIIKALKKIEFVNLMKCLVSNPIFLDSVREDLDYAAPEITLDELGVFLSIYGKLFK